MFAPYALPGNPAAAQAGAFAAGNTQDFYDSLGSSVGGALSAGVSGFGGAAFGSPGGGFINQGGLGFGSNAAAPINGVSSPFFRSYGY